MSKPLFLKCIVLCVMLAVLVGAAAHAGRISLQDPIRLPEDQLMKSVYFFGHWWEPWKSDDTALANDLKRVKDLGFNTICVDHEVSQAINLDWQWLDREYKLAGQEKVYILPWLQLQSVDRESLMKFSHLQLKQAVNQDKQPVPDSVDFRDGEFKEALAHYISVYLDRYADDPALLKVKDGKKLRPVVALMVEVGWRDDSGMPLSFDEDNNAYFRKWMKSSHYDLKHLNAKWGTDYKSFDEIDPCDKKIFNYAFEDKQNMPVAVKEHMTYRARMISDALRDIAGAVRKKHKDVLFVAEIAYPFSADNPDAAAFRWNNANDARIVDFADMVFIRTMGNTSTDLVKKDQEALMLAGKKVVLGYRFFGDSTPERAVAFAMDCASSANGLGYYNWNETADKASAIYNDPARQGFAKLMNTTYEMLYETDKRHSLTGAAAAPAPATAQQAAPAEKPAEAGGGKSTDKPAEQPAGNQLPPAAVALPEAPK